MIYLRPPIRLLQVLKKRNFLFMLFKALAGQLLYSFSSHDKELIKSFYNLYRSITPSDETFVDLAKNPWPTLLIHEDSNIGKEYSKRYFAFRQAVNTFLTVQK